MASEADLVEMCMEQISTNMEELTFLRELAGHLKLQSASRGVESSSSLLLPTLQEAASAEYVAFLVTQETEDQRDWLVRSESPETRETRNVARIMETLLDHFPIQNSQRGFVFNRNGLNPPLEKRLDPEIRSCIAVEVQNEDSPLGWLLAINKKSNVYRNLGDGTVVGEQEFGTHEASLLSSVACLLVTHAQNVELFEQKESLFLGVIKSMATPWMPGTNTPAATASGSPAPPETLPSSCNCPPRMWKTFTFLGYSTTSGKSAFPTMCCSNPNA